MRKLGVHFANGAGILESRQLFSMSSVWREPCSRSRQNNIINNKPCLLVSYVHKGNKRWCRMAFCRHLVEKLRQIPQHQRAWAVSLTELSLSLSQWIRSSYTNFSSSSLLPSSEALRTPQRNPLGLCTPLLPSSPLSQACLGTEGLGALSVRWLFSLWDFSTLYYLELLTSCLFPPFRDAVILFLSSSQAVLLMERMLSLNIPVKAQHPLAAAAASHVLPSLPHPPSPLPFLPTPLPSSTSCSPPPTPMDLLCLSYFFCCCDKNAPTKKQLSRRRH